GFNSLQVAMERPPALKAIVSIYATDDRYSDDVHYEGGARRQLDFVDYCTYMAPMNALPPVPRIYGEGWRDVWRERFETTEPWMLRWLEEQVYGPYWQHGSLNTNYSAIEAATMIVAGWADGYRNCALRTFENLDCPKRVLFGPWPHASTESGLPGPHIDLVPEMLRWWDRWLRDERNGVDEEPPITLFVRRSTRPEPDLAEMRGEWRFEDGWPLERGREKSSALDSATRVPGGEVDELVVRGDVGWSAHLSCAGVMPWGQPMDQRIDDAYSLTYDWDPLVEELELLGAPRLEVTVAADKPVAFLSAKLCDVFEDGTSALVSRGFLNLAQRDSRSDPAPLEPGHRYRVTVPLSTTSWIYEPGHRVRLSIAGADWPNVWPPPEPVTLQVVPAESTLVLPVPDPPEENRPSPQLRPPPAERGDADSTTKAVDSDSRVEWRTDRDILGRKTHVVVDHGSSYDLEVGGRMTEAYYGKVTASSIDPGDAAAESRVRFHIEWPEATVASEVHCSLESDKDNYLLDLRLETFENGELQWQRRWERTIPRRLQ
ncbi:MAG: CocE/NonD family hydrolase, partial [Actinomycetota bacterium]